MPNIGFWEIVLILAVLLLLFGARKLPQLARSIGRSTKEFKSGLREGAVDEESAEEQPAAQPKTQE